MMHRSSQLVTLALALALLTTPAWAQTGMLRGTVVDAGKQPIEGVDVTVTSEQLASYRKSLKTNAKGAFSLRFQPTHLQYRFDLLFEKPGYQSFVQPLMPSSMQQMREEFVMEQAATQVVERHGDLGSVVTGSSSEAVDAFNAGLTAQRDGDLAGARAKFEQAVAADATLIPALVALGQVLLDQRDHAAALDAAGRALALSEGRADALQVKYQALRGLGRNQEADALAAELEIAEDAVAKAKRVYNEGGVAFQAGDKATALAKFKEASALDPRLSDAHHAVATLEYGEGNYEAAAEAAKKALSAGSDDVRTLRVLYDAYDALGRTEELTEIAPRLAAVDPDFGGPKLLEQAAQMWNDGQAAAAVKLSRLALSIDPGLAKAYYFIGLDHLGRGESAEARSALERFVNLAPDDAEAPTAREMLSYIE